MQLVDAPVVLHERDDPRLGGVLGVADQFPRRAEVREHVLLPAEIAQRGARLAGALLLRLHLAVELRLVQLDVPLGKDLADEVDREAVGVVELEGVRRPS